MLEYLKTLFTKVVLFNKVGQEIDSDNPVPVNGTITVSNPTDTSTIESNQTNGSQVTQIVDLYNTNNIKTVGLVTYIGMEDGNGVYCIKKIDTTTDNVFTYATIINNPTVTTYADAWSGILTNTFDIYSTAF